MKQTALLASPVYIGQAQGEEKRQIKRGAKIEPRSSLHFFWVGPPSRLKDAFPFAWQIKLGCNKAVTLVHSLNGAVTPVRPSLQIFCCDETEPRKSHTPPTEPRHIICCLYLPCLVCCIVYC